MYKKIVGTSLVLVLCGCVAYPSKQPQAGVCETKTSSWAIEYKNIDESGLCDGASNEEALACLSVIGVGVPVVTTLYAGSVVIFNNTIHWLEYIGKCSEDKLEKESALINSQLNESDASQ